MFAEHCYKVFRRPNLLNRIISGLQSDPGGSWISVIFEYSLMFIVITWGRKWNHKEQKYLWTPSHLIIEPCLNGVAL